MKKQALALFLVLALALSLAACGGGGKVKSPYAGAQMGDVLQLGGIDWYVIRVEDGKALLVTTDILGKRPYHGEWEKITWETCDMRAYLNGEFYNAFSDEEKEWIAESALVNDVSEFEDFETDAGNDTVDKVFLLSVQEAEEYFTADKDRKAETFEAWWLRTPGRKSQSAASYVNSTGTISVGGYSGSNEVGLRPALWLIV